MLTAYGWFLWCRIVAEENGAQLPPVSKWWIGIYCFAAFWLLVVAWLDAGPFGACFVPVLISFVLVPLLTVVFVIDLFVRIGDAVQGKRASLGRRLWPLLVAAIGVCVYGGICVLAVLESI